MSGTNQRGAAMGNAAERQDVPADIARRADDDYDELQMAALEKLEADARSRHALLPSKDHKEHRLVDILKAGRDTRKSLVNAALNTEDQDHEEYLKKLKLRMDEAGVALSTVEVGFRNLTVEASIYVGNRSEPTVLNSYRNFFEGLLQYTRLFKGNKTRFVILDNISGTIKPGRMTLLLGPPGAGKSTLLKTLANKMQHEGCKISGDITYNGKTFHEFVPQRTSAYIEQTDLHLPELTVRETMNFAARVQGIGHKGEELGAMRERERAAGRKPDPSMDAFLKAQTVEGERESIVTEYMLKLLGLDICADTVVGDAMLRGISGGQKKRVTTAEMVVGPKKTLFMDEISTGLDSSTTFQITKALRDFCHLRAATIFIALLQPQPEAYDQFDDVLLMAEGTIIYHGPRTEIVGFFESCGFKCPERKGVPDFLQEVTSKKDQGQYWVGQGKYRYVPILEFADAFEKSKIGRARTEAMSKPYAEVASNEGKDPLIYSRFALDKMGVIKACLHREWLLVQRNSFVYVFKAVQMGIVAIIVATLFLRTHIHRQTYTDAQLILGFLFFTLIQLFFNGIAEMTFTIDRMPVFFKQRDNLFFPAWAFVVPTTLVRFPISALESLIWTAFTYFAVPLTLDAGRVFMFWLLTFLIHNTAVTLFRAIGALARNLVVANALGALVLLVLLLLGGFVLPKRFVHPWYIWFFWSNPLYWAQQSIIINEFSAGHWQQVASPTGSPGGMGVFILNSRSFHTDYWWVWVGVGVMIGYSFIFNAIVILAHQYLDPFGSSSAMMTEDFLAEREGIRSGFSDQDDTAINVEAEKKRKGSSAKLQAQRSKLAQQSRALREARSKRLQATSQKLIQGSQRNFDSQRSSQRNLGAAQPGAGQGADAAAPGVDSRGSRSQMNLSDSNIESGMVLPFEPMVMTFSDVHYYVPLPPEMSSMELPTIHTMNNKKMLELLVGISGSFRSGVLTALMGVSGAGKTTLMDVLAGRKTGGIIEGDVRINGHTKVQETFSRVSGYCEQFDVHSPQTNIVEALLFSAELRLNGNLDRETITAYVDEVMDLVELTNIQKTIVGLPGVSGLSVEQRKRLTIAVELVANPSIIFMDEPTSGLDARAAAIVMRAVRNIVNTNRTIVCTIHQPSIDIFESFDELLLLKRGGRTIYAGPLGHESKDLVAYFEGIPNVAPIKGGINPATWMLEISTPGAEERLGIDFADIYEKSQVRTDTDKIIEKASTPAEGTTPLEFESLYPRNFMQQALICFRKFWITYWRTPEYNGTRFSFSVGVALLFGTIFWKLGGRIVDSQTIFNVLGCLYTACLFIGILNAVFVQPVISDERAVMYRERGAGMYGIIPWYCGLASVELIYLILQGGLYTCVVYFCCGFQKDAGKFFWFMLFTDLCLIYFTFYGIIAVAITPNLIGAAVISGAFYGLFNLFAGFVMQEKNFPGWWVWLYWGCPVQWTLRGLITSQLGNLEDPVVVQINAPTVSPKEFIFDTFGYESGWLGWDVLVLIAFCALFIGGAGFGLKKLNFQNR